MTKFNEAESWFEWEAIMAGKPKVELTNQNVGKEVAKIIKRIEVNKQSLDFLRFLKKKYDKQ